MIRTVNIGLVPPGQARNEAVSHSKGENLAFIDSDCVALPDWLKNLDNRISEGESLIGGAVVFPDSGYFSMADNVSCFFDQTSFIKSKNISLFAALNMACTRQVFDNVGLFDPNAHAGEDLDWILRAKKLSFQPFFESNAKCVHHGGRNDLKALICHAKTWGAASIHVRKKHPTALYTPKLFYHPTLLTLLSPLIGAFYALRILTYPGMWRYFYTWPAIALSKTVWCLSAAKSYKTGKEANCDIQ